MHLLRLTLAALAFTCAAHAATPGVYGDWRTSTGSVIRIAPCGADACLTVVQLPPHPPHTTDIYNPDPSQRNRALCGLTIGTGFHADDPTHLSGGHLYDPQSGHLYRGTLYADANTLHLRGYIGISLFGRSETWQRAEHVVSCKL